MKNTVTIFILQLTLFQLAYAQRHPSREKLGAKTESFIQAYSAKQSNSNAADVEHFLYFFADNFKDKQIKYNVIVSYKEIFRKGLMEKLRNKVYYHLVNIEDMMVGSNVVFQKIKIKAKAKPFLMDTVVEHTTGQIMSIAHNEDGLIKHLRRNHN
jgi:hypothetical protein